MRIHRFYTPDTELKQDFWLHNKEILHQWNKVLRFRPNQQVVLFDGVSADRLYEITELSQTEAHLKLKTELERKTPKRHVYLFWSLLKSDKNDLVLQKCTELGVANFVPLVSKRSVRKDFNRERAERIVIEAAEQCGRSDIPKVRDPVKLETALDEYKNKIRLVFCDEKGEDDVHSIEKEEAPIGVLVGPEGGWSEEEIKLFRSKGLDHLALHELTLRAETAAIVAAGKLI